jgi:hypothetical protein
MQTAMGGMLTHSIGMDTTHMAIGFMNLTYNLMRVDCLIHYQKSN